MDHSLLIEKLKIATDENVYAASDQLAEQNTDEVLKSMVDLLKFDNPDTRYLAARTLGLMKNNSEALNPLLDAISDKNNEELAGDLMMALNGFDVSEVFVPIFKLYLFGSFKVSRLAKELLDYKEFTITPRVLKKTSKHWNHYSNNVKHDEVFELRRAEVDEMMNDLKEFLED